MPKKQPKRALSSGERSNFQARHKEVMEELQKYISSPKSKSGKETWTFGEFLLPKVCMMKRKWQSRQRRASLVV